MTRTKRSPKHYRETKPVRILSLRMNSGFGTSKGTTSHIKPPKWYTKQDKRKT
jgi:hypothetical protein